MVPTMVFSAWFREATEARCLRRCDTIPALDRSPHCELPESANGAKLARSVPEGHAMRKLTLAVAVAAGFAATPVLACPMHQAAAQTTTSPATASPMMC